MTSALESSYRRALRWYPRWWREAHGDVVLSTLLDVADGDRRSSPRVDELLNLAVSGLLTRLAFFLSSAVRDGIATVALGSGAILSVAFLLSSGWTPWAHRLMNPYDALYPGATALMDFGTLVYSLWIVALVCALARLRTIVRGLMVVATAASVLFELTGRPHFDYGPNTRTLVFLGLLSLLVLLGVPRRPGLVAAVATATALGLTVLWLLNGRPSLGYLSDRAFWDFLLAPNKLIVGVVGCALVAFAGARRVVPAQVIGVSLIPWGVVCAAGLLLNGSAAEMAPSVILIAGVVLAAIVRPARLGRANLPVSLR